MKQYAQLSMTLAPTLGFFGCSALTPENAVKIAIADDPNYAMRQIAGNQFRIYATDSKALMRDIKEAKRQYAKVANDLSGNVAKQWSKEDVSLPSAESYVKYSNNYKSKATINFHSGAIRIETIDTSNPTKSREQAITNTLLLPQDPSKVDLYSADDFKHVYHQYTILVEKGKRDDWVDFLTQKGIGTGVHYPIPLYNQPIYKKLGIEGSAPDAELAANHVISLPVHPSLTQEDLDLVIDAVKQASDSFN